MKKIILACVIFSSCGTTGHQEDDCDDYFYIFYELGKTTCRNIDNKCCECARQGMLLVGDCKYPDYDDPKIREMDCNFIKGMCWNGSTDYQCQFNIIDEWKAICQI